VHPPLDTPAYRSSLLRAPKRPPVPLAQGLTEVTGPLRSPPGRRSYLRGVLDRGAATITPLTGQGSHQVATLGKANALIIVPEWVVQMAAGETADVLVLP